MPTETYSEPTGYAATAAELRRIADALDTLPPTDRVPYATLSILPEQTVDAIDAVALAVIGKRGTGEWIGGDWYHRANTNGIGVVVEVSIHGKTPGPVDPRDAEIERLRAELAEARAAADPDHGRTTAVAEAKPDTLGIAMGRAAVPELKPWESNAPLADRIAESMEPIDPDSSMEAHYDAEMEAGARTQPDMQTRPQCPPECRQNWTRASDPLAHVAHCPNASPPAGA